MARAATFRRFFPAAAALLATTALPSPASAGHELDDRHGSRGLPFDADRLEDRLDLRAERIADLLELTDDQRTAFDRIRADAFAAARPKLERIRQDGEDLRELLDSGSNDVQAVGAKVIEMHRLKQEVRATKDGVESELVKLLTPEQKFAFDALKEAKGDFEERGRERFGHGSDEHRGDRRGRPID